MTETTINTVHGDINANSYGASSSSTTILLLHGMAISQKCFAPITSNKALLDKYRILTFDFPGHGKSSNAPDPPKSYTFPGFADAAIQVLQHQKVSNVIVYGHSMGGHVAIELVSHLTSKPDVNIKVLGYMITGTGPCRGRAQFQEIYATDSRQTLHRQSLPPEEALPVFVKDVYGVAAPQADFALDDAKRSDPQAKTYVFGAAMGEGALDERAFIKEPKVPLAIVNGVDDAFVRLDIYKNLEYGNLWTGKAVVIERSGHSPFLEQRERFAEVFERFVSDVKAS